MKYLTFVVVALAACSHPAAPVGAPATTPVATAAPAAVTLVKLTNGDRACYVDVTTAGGKNESHEGDFDLCPGNAHDASALIGKHVTYTTKPANVQAASCEGNPDCKDSDKVDLVMTIVAAP